MTAAATLRRIAKESKSFPRRFVEQSVRDVRTTVDRRLSTDTGGDRVLSGTTRGGRRTALKVSTSADGSSIVTGRVSPGKGGAAMWSWLEEGTGEPGPTAAKRTWSKAAVPAIEEVERRVRVEFRKVVG